MRKSPTLVRFDSILVRLKEEQLSDALVSYAQFRFHTGSIKSFAKGLSQGVLL